MKKINNITSQYKPLKYVSILLIIAILNSCQQKDHQPMNSAAANKAFILEMLTQKKQLKDYPGKASDSLMVYEPSSLPFGGTYKGLAAFEQFYPAVRKFYDFSRFELQQVYADGDAVFATIKAGIAGTEESIMLCEQFTFKDGTLTEVRLFIHDFPEKPIHTLVNK